MLEIKLFEDQPDGSVLLEAKRYDDEGIAASFTVSMFKGHLNKITTVKQNEATKDTIEQIRKFAALMLKS